MTLRRTVDVLLAVGYLALAAAMLAVALMAYNRVFVPSVDVNLHTDTVGNALQKGSDVKLNGVPVGRVTGVSAVDDGAVVALALEPSVAEDLSRDTTARLLPKTLFGERYVSLVEPNGDAATGLSTGDSIAQDHTDEAVELEEVFDQLLPLLQSIQPEKLSAMLGEMSAMLRGQGRDIGDTMAAWSDYLERLEPHIPTMTADLDKLGRVSSSWADAAPDLLDALDAMTTTSKTLVKQRTTLKDVYAQVISSADTSRGWVTDNRQTIEVLADESREALEAAKPYAKQFPCLLKAARDYIPVMDKTLGKGTDERGIHVRLNVEPSRGKYLPGKDAPTFTSGGSARCPYVTGHVGTAPATAMRSAGRASAPVTIPAPRTRLPQQLAAGAGLGQVNSPAENQMIAELVAPTQSMAPADYPGWNSLLLGPVLRGASVVVR